MKLFLSAIILAFAAPAFAADTSHCKSTSRVPTSDATVVEIEENVRLGIELIQCEPKKGKYIEHGLVVRVNGKAIDYLLAGETMSSSISLQKVDANDTMDAIINYIRAVPSSADNRAQVLEAGQQPFFNRGNGVFERGTFQSSVSATATK
jgi:hypothetical protein